MKTRTAVTMIALALLAGCASDPKYIKASTASDCQPGDREKLARLEASQKDSARKDAWSVAIWGLPSGAPDFKNEIARLKACTGQA